MGIDDKLFNELKEAAIEIWQGYDNTYGYVDEKTDRLSKLKNVKDNYNTIIGMFDINNQIKLYDKVGQDGKALIDMHSGGSLQSRWYEAKMMGVID